MVSADEIVRIERSGDHWKVYYNANGVVLGDLMQKEDGFFDFWPTDRDGCWAAYVLRAIADKLDELNKPWDDIISADPRIGGTEPKE